MTKIETTLLEAVGNLFKNKESNLGIVGHVEHSHMLQFQRELIEDMFGLKTVDSPFHEELCGAFRDIHSYKYLDDPTFAIALDKRLSARGIPMEERKKAIEHVKSIMVELKGAAYQERESGWHPDLKEICDMTRNAVYHKPKHLRPFTGGGPAPERNPKNGY
jgi:hypothetical protein